MVSLRKRDPRLLCAWMYGWMDGWVRVCVCVFTPSVYYGDRYREKFVSDQVTPPPPRFVLQMLAAAARHDGVCVCVCEVLPVEACNMFLVEGGRGKLVSGPGEWLVGWVAVGRTKMHVCMHGHGWLFWFFFLFYFSFWPGFARFCYSVFRRFCGNGHGRCWVFGRGLAVRALCNRYSVRRARQREPGKVWKPNSHFLWELESVRE